MAGITPFRGFSKKGIAFLKKLKKNNTREWFQKHRQVYDNEVMGPARAFVEALGQRLQAISPKINFSPKVNQSIFRIARDTRFSPDKSPYKTHLGLYFWEGTRPRMECSGFYFHLEPPNLMLGTGIYIFPKDLLQVYRESVMDPEYGDELNDLLQSVLGAVKATLGGKHYKRFPAGLDASHPNAELLLHNGIYLGQERSLPDALYNESILDYCFDEFEAMSPLHRWLVNMSQRAF